MRLWIVIVLVALNVGRAGADEVSRVREHLRTARSLLDARDISALTPSQREHRQAASLVLDRYIERGVFPRRTTDTYGALRPRFIDDRGVHCAVGEMIASTSPELAVEINAQYEFSFVRDMKSAALLAWANANGFTLDELAAIQPTYSKPPLELPNPAAALLKVLSPHVAELALACWNEKTAPTQVELRLSITLDGDRASKLSSTGTDEFSRCFAAGASKYVGARKRPTLLTVPIPSLDRLVSDRIASKPCSSNEGAFPKSATVDFAAGTVVTEPANESIDRCLVEHLDRDVEPFHQHLKLMAHVTFRPQIVNRDVFAVLLNDAPKAAWKCVKKDVPAYVSIVVRAKEGDKYFAISMPGTSSTYATCVSNELTTPLHDLLATRSVLRIDGDIDEQISFKLVRGE